MANRSRAKARRDYSPAWHALRAAKKDLGMLVTLEAGKIIAEGQGEVQENDRYL